MKQRISKKTKARAKRFARATAVTAGAGTLSALATDFILSRLMPNSPTAVMIGRVAGGLALGAGANAMGLGEDIVVGAAVGPAIVTGIDLTTRLIGRGPYSPPVAGSVEAMGEPWSPRLL